MVKNRIAELRRSKGMNQRELGEKLGVGQTTVSAWERGQNEPDRETLFKMAKLFDASIDYVLGYKEDSYRRGLSDEEYSKLVRKRADERENERIEREIERQEQLQEQGMTDEEIENILREEERHKWQENGGKTETFEGYLVAKAVDGQSPARRKRLVNIVEQIIESYSEE